MFLCPDTDVKPGLDLIIKSTGIILNPLEGFTKQKAIPGK